MSGIVFLNGNVLSMENDEILSSTGVRIEKGWISEVGSLTASEGEAVVDCTNRWIMPGLSDMHVHLATMPWIEAFNPDKTIDPGSLFYDLLLFQFIANGITSIKIRAGEGDSLRLRDEIAAGQRLGPHMTVDSPMFDGEPPLQLACFVSPEGPDQAKEMVRSCSREGYDQIKIYSGLSRDCFDAVIEESRELGLSCHGHVPYEVGLRHAVESGLRSIGHVSDLFHHRMPDLSYDEDRIQEFADLIVSHGVWVDTTLVINKHWERIAAGDAELLAARPEMAYVHPGWRVHLAPESALMKAMTADPEAKVRLRDLYRDTAKAARVLNRAGARLVAGTDAVNPTVIEGFSLHDELQLLVEDAGLSEYEALVASTQQAAAVLGESDRRGSIAVGKVADLVILAGNPLSDITNTRRIEGVVVAGRYLSRADIEVRMNAIENFYSENFEDLADYTAPEFPETLRSLGFRQDSMTTEFEEDS